MIYILTTRVHTYTHTSTACGEAIGVMTYDDLFSASAVPMGTWIFTDFDRLGFWELELAARVYQELKAAGARVLNNPALVNQRFSLLRRLKNAGLNSFSVWRVEDGEMPDRFPVFLRTQSAHRGVIGELIHDEETLMQEIDKACAEGYPAAQLMIVEYCAQPTDEGVFRKLAAYCIGDTIVQAVSVHENHWAAKYGEDGIAGETLYAEELQLIRDNPFAGDLLKACNIGHIEYGRLDFGLVDGKVEVYEINTNPTVYFTEEHPYPARLESAALSKKLYIEAMTAIDMSDNGHQIEIKAVSSSHKRRSGRSPTVSRWTP
ncbi:MAG: hypothetical protein KAJ73_08745 [Zetaproteobacteria bacterium]|nr:hypothetical protein [Zetaproteobacteria bacterium]